jgi:hypothetical protein
MDGKNILEENFFKNLINKLKKSKSKNKEVFKSKKAKKHYDAALKAALEVEKMTDDYFKEMGRENPFQHLKSKR